MKISQKYQVVIKISEKEGTLRINNHPQIFKLFQIRTNGQVGGPGFGVPHIL